METRISRFIVRRDSTDDCGRMVGKPEVMMRSGLLEQLPVSPSSFQNWRQAR